MTLTQWLSAAAVVVTFLGACIAIYAAQIEVRDSLDTMIIDMARQSKWNQITAFANAIAGALLLAALALSIFQRTSGP